MKPAPPLNCATCNRAIGKRAPHYLLDDNRVVCGGCAYRPHDELFPACAVGWHDVLDHLACTGTRAGTAAQLGLWPRRETR